MIRTLAPLVASLLVLGGAAAAAERPAPAAATADSTRYAIRVTDNNLMGITVTNYGFIGNNFVNRSPSMEYPLGSGYEHLTRGGLWIGAKAIDQVGAFTGVTTGTVDGTAGSSAQAATEFSPAGLDVYEHSRLPNSPYYDPAAISEQDFTTTFSDNPAKVSTLNNSENHRPLDVLVRLSTYSWSFSDYKNFVIFHYVIRNLGPPLQDVWVGVYAELASGPKFAYSTWPPSATGSSLGTWYTKKWVAYDPALRLFREHYCANQPIPSNCALSVTPYWAGYALLGARDNDTRDTTLQVTMAAWKFSPGDTLRDTDVERYAIMSAGTIQDLSGPDMLPISGDPCELLTTGPFHQINPGDSVQVDFVFVGGPEVPDFSHLEDPSAIQRFTAFAQQAYDRDYVVPVPPPSPGLRVVTGHERLDLYWDDAPEFFSDPTSPAPGGRDFEGYRIYLGDDRLALHRIAQFDLVDTTGFNTGLGAIQPGPPVTIDGHVYKYHYTVTGLRDGFKYFCAVTAYDQGSVEIESLESGIPQNKTLAIPAPAPGEPHGGVTVFPNPYRVEARWDQGQQVRDHYLWFANLPERCVIRVYTLSGDLIFDTAFDGSTYHGEGARGIYDPRRELDVAPPTLSGAMYGWNLITREGQAVASGLYLYSVEDLATGKRTVGKFLVVKSDREGTQ